MYEHDDDNFFAHYYTKEFERVDKEQEDEGETGSTQGAETELHESEGHSDKVRITGEESHTA